MDFRPYFFGQKYFELKISSRPKIFFEDPLHKKIIQKNIWSKKYLGLKNFGYRKFFLKTILIQKNIGGEILSPKTFWSEIFFVRKNCGSKNFCFQNNFGFNKILGPTQFWVHKSLL